MTVTIEDYNNAMNTIEKLDRENLDKGISLVEVVIANLMKESEDAISLRDNLPGINKASASPMHSQIENVCNQIQSFYHQAKNLKNTLDSLKV